MASKRLVSLDVLRGFDMFFIMGGEVLVRAIAAVFGHPEFRATFGHAEWHGLHFMDTVFPLFIFLAGASWPFSCAAQLAKGRSKGAVVRKVLVRMFLLFFLGLTFFSPFFSFDPSKFRYSSVLCQIGICWGAAALLQLFVPSWKTRLGVAFALLVGHWALLFFTVAPDLQSVLASNDPNLPVHLKAYGKYGMDGFSFFGSIACWVDRMYMPGALNQWFYEVDGTLAKLTGTALAILGTLAGDLLRTDCGERVRLRRFLFAAAGLALLACAGLPWCPMNKHIWTSTFVLMTGAYAFLLTGLAHAIFDVRGWTKGTSFFQVIGLNAITIYLAQRIIDFRKISVFFLNGIAANLPTVWGDLVLALGYVAACWLLLYFLYRHKVFLKV